MSALSSRVLRVEIPDLLRFFVEKKARYKVVYGGRGSLKSWTIARCLLGLARSRKLLILCAREFQKSIKDSVHRLLSRQIQLLGLQPEFDIRATSIVHRFTGSEFIFVGLHFNTVDLKSLEGVNICWVEEAEAVSEDSWRILDPTIRAPGSEIWVSFNPGEEEDPTYKRFVTNPRPDTICKMVSWKDNYWLPEELRKQAEWMRENDPESFLHVWGGQCWFKNEAQVLNGKWGIKEFDVDSIPERSGPYFGADWGFSQDPTALVKSYTSTLNPDDVGQSYVLADGTEVYKVIHKDLYIAEEAFALGCEIQSRPDCPGLVELFEQVSEARKFPIICDCARPETISHMSNEGFMVEPCTKWTGCAEDGVTYLRGFDHIWIHPSCTNMLREARLWSHKTDPFDKTKVLRALRDGQDNGWDALRYSHQTLITRTPDSFSNL